MKNYEENFEEWCAEYENTMHSNGSEIMTRTDGDIGIKYVVRKDTDGCGAYLIWE